jgi:hypothetical protein
MMEVYYPNDDGRTVSILVIIDFQNETKRNKRNHQGLKMEAIQRKQRRERSFGGKEDRFQIFHY